jgi:hypothetical protein
MEAYSLGSVNVDSLKEALLFLATVYPFVDETAKEAFTAQVNGLDSAGNPNEGVVDQIHPTETPEENATETTVTETPVEDSTEDTTVAPEGASVIGSATASSPAPEMSADAKIADLERQLADARAAATQTPPPPTEG